MAQRPAPARSPLGRALELGIEIAGCVVIGMLSGYYIDRWRGTEPWFLLIFMLLGFAAAIRVVLRYAAQAAPSVEPPDPKASDEPDT